MAKKRQANLLEHWILDALRDLGGQGHLIDVAMWIEDHKKNELRAEGDLYYTWQYDMRWAATRLRKQGRLQPSDGRPGSLWRIA